MRRPRAIIPVLLLIAAVAIGIVSVSRAASGPRSADARLTSAIHPLTDVVPSTDTGYFSDPYPIHTARPDLLSAPEFSGTTPGILSCSGPLRPGCGRVSPLTISTGAALRSQAGAHDVSFVHTENDNVYQASNGSWQMVTTVFVQPRSSARRWTILVHAHPASSAPSGSAPRSWVLDSILVGSLSHRAPADYDGKYFDDAGRLYLVYSGQVQAAPPHNGIVAQRLSSFSTPASSAPRTLIAPATADGGYNSEYLSASDRPDGLKLDETGNITEIDGKFVMAYSTGDFNTPDYKVGIAWSDTFLPAPGGSYKRVLMQDTKGVWGQGDHAEVLYLLQSQTPDWPNYVADRVIAPGVPSIVEVGGHWVLFFAGFLPSDAPHEPNGFIDAMDRRPFYLPLDVHIPSGATVAGTSGYQLDHWITADTSGR